MEADSCMVPLHSLAIAAFCGSSAGRRCKMQGVFVDKLPFLHFNGGRIRSCAGIFDKVSISWAYFFAQEAGVSCWKIK